MKEVKVRCSCGLFLNPKSVLVVTVVAAIICVLSRTDGASCSKSGRRITLLSATVTEVDTTGRSAFEESQEGAEQWGEWRTVRMRVTAYCPCPKCCGKYSDGVTACGHKIRPGDTFVAADKEYSFGTEMIIAGYNNTQPVKVLDRGGVIRGNRLDVFFGSHKEALKWGVKYLDVKICRR